MPVPPAGAATSGGSARRATQRAARGWDRLVWSVWHRALTARLGVATWLAGLTMGAAVGTAGSVAGGPVRAVAGVGSGVALLASVTGVCCGALLLGFLADRFGRRQLLLTGLAVYVAASGVPLLATSGAQGLVGLVAAGAGLGGALVALVTAVTELAPAAHRGRAMQVVAAGGWLGVACGAALASTGFRPGALATPGSLLAPVVGAAVGLTALVAVRRVPESPRWLASRGRFAEADRMTSGADRRFEVPDPTLLDDVLPTVGRPARTREPGHASPESLPWRARAALWPALLVPLSCVAGAVALPAGSVLAASFGVSGPVAALWMAPLAGAGLLGSVACGGLADRVGHRWVVVVTYLGCGLALATAAELARRDVLSTLTLGACWSLVLLLAAAGAAAALTTVVETAPLRTRGATAGLFVAALTAASATVGGVLHGRLAAGLPSAWVTGSWYVTATVLGAGGFAVWRLRVDVSGRLLGEVPSTPGSRPGTSRQPLRTTAPHRDGHSPTRGRRHGYAPWERAASLSDRDPRRLGDVARILHALGTGSLSHVDLEARVSGGRWEPGRFRAALRTALADGHVVEVGDGRFARKRPGHPPVG